MREREITLIEMGLARRRHRPEDDLSKHTYGRRGHRKLVHQGGVELQRLWIRIRRRQGQDARGGEDGGRGDAEPQVRVVELAAVGAAAVFVLVVELPDDE